MRRKFLREYRPLPAHQRFITRSPRAFTLIELLVVVTILMLLIALLLPALDQVRDQAVTTQCLSQMRQLSAAYHFYSTDYNGVLLPVALTNNFYDPITFTLLLDSYLGTGTPYALWRDPGGPPELFSPGNRNFWNYGLNPLLARKYGAITWRPPTAPVTLVRLAELPFPATTAMYCCKLSFSPPDINQSWFIGACPFMQITGDYGPWPLHGKTRVQTITHNYGGVPAYPAYYESKDTNVVRMDGSARTYAWFDVIPWNYFPELNGKWPTGSWSPYWAPRSYLWSGSGPGRGSSSGWLME